MIALAFLFTAQPSKIVVHKTGVYAAQSGRATATAKVGEAEVTYLSVSSAGHASLSASNVQGFAWLPGKKPALLFAAGGLYGNARLAVWTPQGVHDLVRVRKSHDESFKLVGAEVKGTKLRVRYLYGGAEDLASKYVSRSIAVSLSKLAPKRTTGK